MFDSATNTVVASRPLSRGENTGTHNQIQVTSVTHRGEAVKVGIKVTGGGFNGEGSFTFEIKDGLIHHLTLT